MRLAWHDSGTYDAGIPSWPACGGANGSIRFASELAHGANAGLIKGVTVYLAPIAKRHPSLSYADLLQLASATAIAHAGGPVIPMRYGRVDAPTEAQCPESGRLPDAAAPFGGTTPMAAPDAAGHLRAVFFRMGFNDAEIVALSGAHTIGRAFKERSGTTPHGCAAMQAVSGAIWLHAHLMRSAQLHQRHGIHQTGCRAARRGQARPGHGAPAGRASVSVSALTCCCFAAWRPVLDAQVAGL